MRLEWLGAASTFMLISGLAFASAPDRQPLPRVDVKLTPVLMDGTISRIDIAETLENIAGSPERVLVSVPARIALTMGQTYTTEDVQFEDAAGSLPVRMNLDQPPPGMPLQMRSFIPLRATRGAIRIHYSAIVTPALRPRKPGPSYDLRGTEGGVGGSYFSFLLLPLQAPRVDLRLAWDLSQASKDARVVSTGGSAGVTAQLPPMDVYSRFFLAGHINGESKPGSAFQSYWIGTPPFDAAAASDWSARSFAVLQQFFKEPDVKPYTLLMRPYARPRDGGGATRGGFMLEYGTGAMTDMARRIMFTHEMVHHFVGVLDGDTSANAWFGEGLAEFFKVRLPLRAGMLDVVDAAREFGVMTNAYYTSPLVRLSYKDVAEQRWAGGAAQAVPYNRGFIYFTNLDAKIRARSHGRRSLDDLVLAMLERRRAGKSYDERSWRALLRSELGAEGETDFDRMLRGALIVPPDNAFGECFERRRVVHPRPELGMSEDSFLVPPYRVTGLEPGSRAARSGLLEGDSMVSFEGVTPRVAHSASNVKLDPVVTIVVERAGKPLLFQFSTAGPAVVEYYWMLKPGHPAQCALR